jgi:hypothetical protein
VLKPTGSLRVTAFVSAPVPPSAPGAAVVMIPSEGGCCYCTVVGRGDDRKKEEDVMKRLVEFPSESGEPILVEVEDVGLGGETRRGLSTSAVVERAQTSFEDALERARPMATNLVGKLHAIGDAAGSPPDEVQVEFGIVLNAEAGAILASASAGANYKVTITWRRPPA